MNPGTLAYLATPYSQYPKGLHQAFIDASALAARLLRAGICAYSPIAHTHPLALYGLVDPLDHSIWLPFDELMMARCDTLIVAHMEGWQESLGIAHEVTYFEVARKPIYDLPDIATCNLVRRPDVWPRADHQRERLSNLDAAALLMAGGDPEHERIA